MTLIHYIQITIFIITAIALIISIRTRFKLNCKHRTHIINVDDIKGIYPTCKDCKKEL